MANLAGKCPVSGRYFKYCWRSTVSILQLQNFGLKSTFFLTAKLYILSCMTKLSHTSSNHSSELSLQEVVKHQLRIPQHVDMYSVASHMHVHVECKCARPCTHAQHKNQGMRSAEELHVAKHDCGQIDSSRTRT